jgi:hypothetical protein
MPGCLLTRSGHRDPLRAQHWYQVHTLDLVCQFYQDFRLISLLLRFRDSLQDLMWRLKLWMYLLFSLIGHEHVCRVVFLNRKSLLMVLSGMLVFVLLVNLPLILKLSQILFEGCNG